MNPGFRAIRNALLSTVACTALPSIAQTAPAEPRAAGVTVTVDNFKRAESDMYFSTVAKQGGFGKLRHQRDLMPIDRQSVVRANRDTAYSTGIFDLDAGPVTITLPDAGKRFRSVIAINEDHYVTKVAYGKGPYTFTREQIGTRYVMIGVRTLVDARDPADLQVLYTLAAPGRFEVPEWDNTSQKRVRDALVFWPLARMKRTRARHETVLAQSSEAELAAAAAAIVTASGIAIAVES